MDKEEKSHFVEEVMQKNVISIDSISSVKDAAIMMMDTSVGCLVVTNGKTPIGMVTERDLARRVISRDLPSNIPISEVMSSPLIKGKQDYTLWEIAQLMKTNSIHRIPIEKDDQLVGILTSTDLVKTFCLASGNEICKITENILYRILN